MDHLSGGRVTLGVGYGWNRAEAEDHGVDFGRRRAIVVEHLAAMEAIWSCDEAEFHGEFVDFGPTWSWPKPLQQPRVRTLVGGGATETVLAAAAALDGWIPIGGSGLGRALPACGRWPSGPAATRPRSAWSPSGPSRRRASSSTSRGLGVTEVVLRIRAGDERSVRAELEALAPLVAFAATLEQA